MAAEPHGASAVPQLARDVGNQAENPINLLSVHIAAKVPKPGADPMDCSHRPDQGNRLTNYFEKVVPLSRAT